MVSLALGLAAASALAAAPPPPPARPPSPRTDCARSLDPLFVRFVAPAPSSGPNPLFRLIAAPAGAAAGPAPPGAMGDCTRLLTRLPPNR